MLHTPLQWWRQTSGNIHIQEQKLPSRWNTLELTSISLLSEGLMMHMAIEILFVPVSQLNHIFGKRFNIEFFSTREKFTNFSLVLKKKLYICSQ